MSKYTKFTKEEQASWPKQHKKCRGCQEVLPFSRFNKNRNTLFGIDNNCRECRKPKSKVDAARVTWEQKLLHRAKYRAKKYGYAFDLTIDDIVIPTHCPVLGVEISRVSNSRYVPSIDKRNPSGGYTKDNIVIMSRRANVLKNDMSKEEAVLLSRWMDENCADWTIVYV